MYDLQVTFINWQSKPQPFVLFCCPFPVTQQLYGLCVFAGKIEDMIN